MFTATPTINNQSLLKSLGCRHLCTGCNNPNPKCCRSQVQQLLNIAQFSSFIKVVTIRVSCLEGVYHPCHTYSRLTEASEMTAFSFQSAIIYILSIYYRLFSRVEYTDSTAKREAMTTKPQREFDNQIDMLHGVMENLDRTSLDEFQITSLLKRERYYRDSRQWQKLRNCYHPDPSKTRIEVAA